VSRKDVLKVMLSGESAGGNFPAETVAMMAEVCVEAEQFVWPASGTQRLNAPAGHGHHEVRM